MKSGKTIAGTLSSSKAKCIKNRTFGVGYKTHTGGYGPYVVHSDESGHWKLGCKNVHAQKVLTF